MVQRSNQSHFSGKLPLLHISTSLTSRKIYNLPIWTSNTCLFAIITREAIMVTWSISDWDWLYPAVLQYHVEWPSFYTCTLVELSGYELISDGMGGALFYYVQVKIIKCTWVVKDSAYAGCSYVGISIYSRYPRATRAVWQPLSPVVDTFQPTWCESQPPPLWIFSELEHKNPAAL